MHLTRNLRATAVALALVGLCAAPASADSQDDPHILGYTLSGNGGFACPPDDGGECAWAEIYFKYGDDEGRIKASFTAYNEIFTVRDGYADGLAAVGQLRYKYRGEWVTHAVSASGGTKGRNFDLAEELDVEIRVCQEVTGICTQWWWGEA